MKVKYEVDIKINTLLEIPEDTVSPDTLERMMHGEQLLVEEDRQSVISQIADILHLKKEEITITHEDVRGIIEESESEVNE